MTRPRFCRQCADQPAVAPRNKREDTSVDGGAGRLVCGVAEKRNLSRGFALLVLSHPLRGGFLKHVFERSQGMIAKMLEKRPGTPTNAPTSPIDHRGLDREGTTGRKGTPLEDFRCATVINPGPLSPFVPGRVNRGNEPCSSRPWAPKSREHAPQKHPRVCVASTAGPGTGGTETCHKCWSLPHGRTFGMTRAWQAKRHPRRSPERPPLAPSA